MSIWHFVMADKCALNDIPNIRNIPIPDMTMNDFTSKYMSSDVPLLEHAVISSDTEGSEVGNVDVNNNDEY